MLEKIFSNKLLATPVLIGIAAGAVVAIAGGFKMTYEIVTFLSNRF